MTSGTESSPTTPMEEEPSTTTNGSSDLPSSSWEGWEELMGKDIMMKTIEEWNTEFQGDYNSRNDSILIPGGEKKKDESEMGDAVLLHIEGYCLGHDDDNNSEFNGESILELFQQKGDESNKKKTPFFNVKDWFIALGDGDILQGLEMAVRFLPLNGCAIVKCHSKFAYGLNGRLHSNTANPTQDEKYAVLPSSQVAFRIYIREVIDSVELNKNEGLRIKLARQKKDIGNDCYKFDWTTDDEASGYSGKSRALKAYGSAMELMRNVVNKMNEEEEDNEEGQSSNSDDERKTLKDEASSILVDSLNNIAAVHLRAKSYALAKQAAANAIQFDTFNMKALCRASKAAMLDPSVTFEESDLAIRAAEEIDGDNKEVQKLRIELERRKKAYNKKEKAMYAKMMKGVEDVKATEPSSDQLVGKEQSSSKSDDQSSSKKSLEMEKEPKEVKSPKTSTDSSPNNDEKSTVEWLKTNYSRIMLGLGVMYIILLLLFLPSMAP